MKPNIHGYQTGTARKRGEGLRSGTVRYLPRGAGKKDYARQDYFDVWLPTLAPSRELMRWLNKEEINRERWQSFVNRFKQ